MFKNPLIDTDIHDTDYNRFLIIPLPDSYIKYRHMINSLLINNMFTRNSVVQSLLYMTVISVENNVLRNINDEPQLRSLVNTIASEYSQEITETIYNNPENQLLDDEEEDNFSLKWLLNGLFSPEAVDDRDTAILDLIKTLYNSLYYKYGLYSLIREYDNEKIAILMVSPVDENPDDTYPLLELNSNNYYTL